MLNKRSIPNGLFAAVILIAVGLSGLGFFTFQRDLAVMNRASQEEISWSTTQLEIELMRFRDTLRSTDRGESTSISAINNRFDILWSRVVVFQRGAVGKRLREYDTENVVGRLLDLLKKQELNVVNLAPDDFETMAVVHHAFLPFSDEMRQLGQQVFVGEEAIAADIRKQMRNSATFTLVLSVASVVFMLMALAYYGWQGRRFRALADKNLLLAEKAQKADRAKSRFLTMMSHELRTPMNGVLGLLALVRQTTVTRSQDRLLEQADRSANQMINMLTDILDFSAQEADGTITEVKPFALRDLPLSLVELLEPDAQRAGVDFSATCTTACPRTMRGDFVRLRQSFSHLVRYFIETAGIGRIDLTFDCSDAGLTGRINLKYDPDGEDWTPDLVLGQRNESADSFAADALGPAVARGVIRNMGGEITLSESVNGRVCVCVTIPMEVVTQAAIRVKCEVQSAMMQSLCRAALSDSDITFVEDDSAGDVHVVLMEAGIVDEAKKIGTYRLASPDIYILGIGAPNDTDLYNQVIGMPFQRKKFRDAVFHRVAS